MEIDTSKLAVNLPDRVPDPDFKSVRRSVIVFRLSTAIVAMTESSNRLQYHFANSRSVYALCVASFFGAVMFAFAALFRVPHAWYGFGLSALVLLLGLFGVIYKMVEQFEESVPAERRTQVGNIIRYVENQLEYMAERVFRSKEQIQQFVREFELLKHQYSPEMIAQIEKLRELHAQLESIKDELYEQLGMLLKSLEANPVSKYKELDEVRKSQILWILYVAQCLVSLDYNVGCYRKLVAKEQRELTEKERKVCVVDHVAHEQNVAYFLEEILTEIKEDSVDEDTQPE